MEFTSSTTKVRKCGFITLKERDWFPAGKESQSGKTNSCFTCMELTPSHSKISSMTASFTLSKRTRVRSSFTNSMNGVLDGQRLYQRRLETSAQLFWTRTWLVISLRTLRNSKTHLTGILSMVFHIDVDIFSMDHQELERLHSPKLSLDILSSTSATSIWVVEVSMTMDLIESSTQLLLTLSFYLKISTLFSSRENLLNNQEKEE